MLEDSLYTEAKRFLDSYSFPLDFDLMISQLKKITLINYELNDCFEDINISFDESMLFGKSGSVSKTNISFNKTRLETLINLKIDCNDANHIKKIYEFYNSYDEKLSHNKYEICLYEFMKKYIAGGYEHYFTRMGSYKTIPYELLDTIFHENEHIFQYKYEKFLKNINECPNDLKSKLLLFTVLFNTIYSKLLKSNVDFEYERQNHIFPIEFDARYEAMVKLNIIKQKFYSNDTNFAKHIVNSSLLPADFDIDFTCKKIFNDYENLYNLYELHYGKDLYSANLFVINNKTKILQEIKNRYLTMQKIVVDNKKFLIKYVNNKGN